MGEKRRGKWSRGEERRSVSESGLATAKTCQERDPDLLGNVRPGPPAVAFFF
jgi:hypothetical protein